MRLRAACLLLAFGLAACRGKDSIPGLSDLAKSCQSEPTQLCFQLAGRELVPIVLLPGDGKLVVAPENHGIFVRFWAREGSYSVHFAPPAAGQIVPGVYRDAVLATYNQPEAPTLSADSPHDTCSGPGSFILYDIAFDSTGTKVERLDVAFEIAGCGGDRDQVLRGRVRVNEVRPPGLKGQLARFFGPTVPDRPPFPILSLDSVHDLCAVDNDRFLCIQGNAGAWTAAGRREVFTPTRDHVFRGQLNWGGGLEFSGDDFHPVVDEDARIKLSPRRGTLFLPGHYESSNTDPDNSREPFLEVGRCSLARRGPNRAYVYEAEFGIDGKPRHFLADFEARCGTDVVVGRLALGSELVARARTEAAGDPERLQAALSRILGERRKQIAAAPRPVVSLETLDSFCPDREGTFLCFRSTAGEAAGLGRSLDAGAPLFASVGQSGGITVSLPKGEAAVGLAPPRGEELRRGALYENARCDPLAFGGEGPYLVLALRDAGGGSLSCREDFRGRFKVLTLDRQEDGSLRNVAVAFELRTAGGAPVAGRLRVTGVDENNGQAARAAKVTDRSAEGTSQPAPAAPAPTPPPPVVAEADARCSADGRTFERRGDTWMESGTERSQPTVTLTRGQDPKLDLMALKARIWTALNLGPKVRAYVDGKVTEILQGNGYPKDPFAGAHCEVFGKVRLPRRITEMGSALDAQLRQDGKRGLHVGARFLVGRDGKVSELLAADGLPEEYRALLLQDLQKMTYTPATLDGQPVPVVQSGTLTY